MGETEIKIFVVLSGIVLLIMVIGIFAFIFQYSKRRYLHIKEKETIIEVHKHELLTTQLESQQQTMQHIGREIHDSVGQKLTLASIYSKQLAAGPKPDDGKKIIAISNIIDESLAELRQLSKTLTNPEIADKGLYELLYEEAKRITISGACYMEVENNVGNIYLQQPEKNILFRLLQEFIQNSLKHSGCRKIKIILSKENENLIITATDDGKGFDTSAVADGIGLQNMKRRAEQLNASMHLFSQKNKGTVLTLQMQLTK
jgi:signal transduction histidine kinase